ncbi:LD-carboxypeptidase [Reichenbachiella sp. MSK19-1]|uniref:S66 peptidase family protein n=1 Tax=Reichenbachiella sp. MSK19-1 TaxID=1897631 RepID=UPI000E6CF48E|nr:LD-carboxypeptidase [Reichenbachiella sp. MSK19-1]RJE74425.1 hypothetical protein BGP76_14795 [Reichenbachiella sp. MSK19-1]
MKRRNFIQKSSLTVAMGALGIQQAFSSNHRAIASTEVIKPKVLKLGDTIGLITPASAVSRSAFEKTLENIDRLGFKAVYSDNIRVKRGFLAGTDEQRLADIHAMFANDQVDGIVCARGGYGTGRLLSEIDYSIIKANPKVLIGYSDITALLYGIYQQTGLVCFHGPVGASNFTDFTTDGFNEVLMNKTKGTVIARPKTWEEKGATYDTYTITPGSARGKLIGGNLSLVVSLIGTPHDIDFTDKIVFIEEIGESSYRVDRMLTQLLQSGKLEKVRGIALGIFNDCDYEEEDQSYPSSISLREVLEDRLEDLGIPVMYGLPFGHIADNATLPFGIEVELDASNHTLTLLESGVS